MFMEYQLLMETIVENTYGYDCPCNTGYNYAYYPPSFVGNRYYCESGNSQSFFAEKLYAVQIIKCHGFIVH